MGGGARAGKRTLRGEIKRKEVNESAWIGTRVQKGRQKHGLRRVGRKMEKGRIGDLEVKKLKK